MLYAVMAVVGLIALICIVSLFAVYRMAFYTDRKHHPAPDHMPKGSQYAPYAQQLVENVRRLAEVPYEPVQITSFDGLTLHGRYYDGGPDAPVLILCHGYRSTALRDASGGAPYGIRNGMSVLLIDQRAHGKSEGKNITFGINERRDCLKWVEYVIKRVGSDARIMLLGVSMGAATVMMATDLGLPENVKCIMADCGYTSPEDIIINVAHNMGAPVWLSKPFVRAAARVLAGFKLNESSAIKAAANFDRPVLIIHGDEDRLVPCDMGRRIKAASNENCRIIEVPGAGHGISYYVDKATYEAALDSMRVYLEK